MSQTKKRMKEGSEQAQSSAVDRLAQAQLIHEISQSVGLPWSLQDYLDDLALPHAHYIVTLDGFVGIHAIAGEAEITNIAVRPQRQKQGLAQDLLNQMAELFEALDVVVCFLEVREQNLAAQRAYQKWGFRQVARRKNYYHQPTEDALVWQWEKA